MVGLKWNFICFFSCRKDNVWKGRSFFHVNKKLGEARWGWKIPWTEEPGGLQSMGSLGVGHDWATSLSLFTFMHWKRKWQPAPVFLLGESQGRGSLVGCRLWGRTRLKQLSSRSSSRWGCSALEDIAWGQAVNTIIYLFTEDEALEGKSGHTASSQPSWKRELKTHIHYQEWQPED